MKEASQVHDLHFSGFFKARVVNNVDESGEGVLGLFIPSIMTEVSNMTETPTPTSHVINEPIFENQGDHHVSPKISIDNYIWARPCAFFVENGSSSNGSGGRWRIPRNGTMVTVYFENEDPNRPYWLPFTSTVEGDVISGREIGKGVNLSNSSANWTSPAKKVNIDVIAEYDDGSVIVVDKNSNSNSFALRWSNGHTLSVCHSKESGIFLETQKGHIVYLDENSGEIRVRTHSGKARITLADNGNINAHAESNVTLNSNGTSNVVAQGKLLVKSNEQVSIEAPIISMGGGSAFASSNERGVFLETKKGHTVYLEENSSKIRVKTHSGKAKLTLDDTGNITANAETNVTVNSKGTANVISPSVKMGNSLSVSHPAEGGVFLETMKGHTVHLDEASGEINAKTHSGKSKMTLADSGDITVHAENSVTVTSNGVANVAAPSIYMGATDSILLETKTGHSIHLEEKTGKIRAKTPDSKTEITLDKVGDITTYAEKSITIKSNGTATVLAKDELLLKSDKRVKIESPCISTGLYHDEQEQSV